MFLTILGVFSFLVTCFAQQSPRELYDQGQYQEALNHLKFLNATDYYNAGNCLYRLGKIGQAFSYFEKANAMNPGNNDILHNLKIAETSLKQAGALPKNVSFWSGLFVPFAHRLPEVYFNFMLALSLGFFCIVTWRLKKQMLTFPRTFSKPIFLISCFVVLLSVLLSVAAARARNVKLAAVIADIGIARSGPNNTFTELFKLPAGTTVEQTEAKREGWQQIRFSLGNVGWMMEKDLLPL